MPQIRVLLGYQQGQVYALGARPFVFGREPACDIVLASDSPASRMHAKIECSAGEWTLTDLGSRNGTLINGAQLTTAPLDHNDEITVGENVFVFEYNDNRTAETGSAASRAMPLNPEGLQNQPEIQSLVKSLPAIVAQIDAPATATTTVRDVLTAIIAGGHCLLLGLSADSKAALLGTLGNVLGVKTGRVELTPNITPLDIAGTDVLDTNSSTGINEPKLLAGPLFSNVFMAEDMQRASSAAKARILSAMKERRLLLTKKTWTLPQPFVVLAACPRREIDGDAPLQHDFADHFMFAIEASGLESAATDVARKSLIDADTIARLAAVARDLSVDEWIVDYAVRIACATRPSNKVAPPVVKRCVSEGAGTNTAYSLLMAAKAQALLQGKFCVTQANIRAVAKLVLHHRLTLNANAKKEQVTEEMVIRKILDAAIQSPA